MQQGSEEWLQARCGMITASNFHRAMTDPKTKKDKDAGVLSQTASTFLDEVVAEMDSGVPIAHGATVAMKWGSEHEAYAKPLAIEKLREEFGRGDFIEAAGANAFCVHPDHPGFGCSPDFLVGDDALGEIKCPFNSGRHVTAACSTAAWFLKEHKWQIVGNLWITGRTQYYVCSYNPRSTRPMSMATIQRDDKLIMQLETRLLVFREKVLDRLAQFQNREF